MTDEQKELWEDEVAWAAVKAGGDMSNENQLCRNSVSAILAADAELQRLREEADAINTDRKLLMETINEKADEIDRLRAIVALLEKIMLAARRMNYITRDVERAIERYDDAMRDYVMGGK